MARYLIPPKTKRETTFIKSITYKDILVFGVCFVLAALAVSTNIPVFKWVLAVLFLIIGLALCLSWGQYHKGYDWVIIIWTYLISKKKYDSSKINSLFDYKNDDGIITFSGRYAAVLELSPIEFLLFRQSKQEQVITQLATALRYIKSGSIVKTERPIDYSLYITRYRERYTELEKARTTYIQQKKAELGDKFDEKTLNLTEFNSRLNILADKVKFLEYINTDKQINAEVFSLVIYETDKTRLESQIKETKERLNKIGLAPKRLNSPEITTFLQYFLYKKDLKTDEFKFPAVEIDKNSLKIGEQKWNIATIGKFPVFAEGNAWASPLFSVPGTNVVINFGSVATEKVTKNVNKAVKELRYRYLNEKDVSAQQDLQIQVSSLMSLLQQFQLGNESIHNTNFYVMYKDEDAQNVVQTFHGAGFLLNCLKFRQFEGFTSMLPFVGKELLDGFSRHIQSVTLAAAFPFINNLFMDEQGDYLGDFRYPIFWYMWQRNRNRVNSNIFAIGQSGNGKTYTMKKLLMQQRLRGTHIFALDCEREYNYLADKLGGQVIEMSGGSTINPFQIFPSFTAENTTFNVANDLSAQCSFLSEWFKSIFPEMDLDTRTALNNSIAEMYKKAKITEHTDFTKLKDTDYPTFDTLYNVVKNKARLASQYNRQVLERLTNYLSLFIGNGIYAPLWNGATQLNIKNEFTVFDFQQLFANSNTEICNAQMMLLMRLLMREVINIKNKNEAATDNNKTRILVVVDEAHRYISTKYPVALDTLEQFARRIRKYDGSILVATQNIDDFIGTTEETRVKAGAIINNCQYSMLFGLKADDVNKVQQLYSQYGGGLTAEEINFLSSAERGQMLFLVEPEKRSIINVSLLPNEQQYIIKPEVEADRSEEQPTEERQGEPAGDDDNQEPKQEDPPVTDEQPVEQPTE